MLRVGVVGINHKLAELTLREQLAKTCQKHFGFSDLILNEQFVVLSTCNRTEVYFSAEDLAATHIYLLSILRKDVDEEFDHKLYSYFGLDCFIHLVKVTSGLDSAIIAETEIQGQVKTAYEMTIERGSLPSELHFLFQKSLGIAKKIRTEMHLGRGKPELEDAIMQAGREFFNQSLEPKILFIGASAINQKILKFLKSRQFNQVTLCNRSDTQGQEVAKSHGVNWLNWDGLRTWSNYDWIILGTKSPNYLIKSDEIKNRMVSHKLIIDLSVPRNVDPVIGQNDKITLLNIDQINQLLKDRHLGLMNSLAEAESKIVQSAHFHAHRYVQREVQKIKLVAFPA